MIYPSEIDEDAGFCPECGSSDTLSLESKAKRVCLKCEFYEEFDSYAQVLLAWRTKVEPRRALNAGRSTKATDVVKPEETQEVAGPHKNTEWYIDDIEPGVTRITIPTCHRDGFNSYLALRKVEQAHPSKTDVWNGIESAYTTFNLAAKRSFAAALVEDWITS